MPSSRSLRRLFRPLCGATTRSTQRRATSAPASPGVQQQDPDPHQAVDRRREPEHPADSRHASVSRLPHQPDGFQSTEDLLDPFALPLAQGVEGVACPATVDRRVAHLLRGDVQRHLDAALLLHKLPHVVPLVRSQCYAMVPRQTAASTYVACDYSVSAVARQVRTTTPEN